MTNLEFIEQYFSNRVFDYNNHSLPHYDEFLGAFDPESGFRIIEVYGAPYPCEGECPNISDVNYVDSKMIRMDDGREIMLSDVDADLIDMIAKHFMAFDDWCGKNFN